MKNIEKNKFNENMIANGVIDKAVSTRMVRVDTSRQHVTSVDTFREKVHRME